MYNFFFKSGGSFEIPKEQVEPPLTNALKTILLINHVRKILMPLLLKNIKNCKKN